MAWSQKYQCRNREHAIQRHQSWWVAKTIAVLRSTHFEERYIAIELQIMSNMQHGIENEKNGLATFMGKVMPVFYPGCIFQDDGCMKKGLQLNRSMVISGDGSIMMKGIENVKTTVEIKCPVPGKVWTTDTYYQIRTRYSTQVMSAMDAKCCVKCVIPIKVLQWLQEDKMQNCSTGLKTLLSAFIVKRTWGDQRKEPLQKLLNWSKT